MFRSVNNPSNPFLQHDIEWEDPPPAVVQVTVEDARSILTENQSPDIPFRWSLNPYRGCAHACAWCYARPTHERLGLGAGTDFETRLFVKPEAPRLLRQALQAPRWQGEPIHFSGNTDCYQPIERRWELTRACLSTCADYRNPVTIITRSPLVTRDVDLLTDLASRRAVRVCFSVEGLSHDLCHGLSPGAPAPVHRLRAMAALAAAGIPVGVSVAPVVPGLNDREIPAVLQACRDAGATWASATPIRLAGSGAPVFLNRLERALPGRHTSVVARLRRLRQGALNDPRFGHRMTGSGCEWAATERLFEVWHDRLGFGEPPPFPDPSPFRRPGQGAQQGLFDHPP